MTAVLATRILTARKFPSAEAAETSHDDEAARSLAFLDKPAGMLVHSSMWAGPPEHALVDDAEILLGPGFHPLHRLDRQTSGVVAFARKDAVARWQRVLTGERADKRYWALVRGHVRGAVEVDHPLRDDDDHKEAPAKNARSVVTPLLHSDVERCSLVEVRLLSGRRHQARRHLKHISHPVIGDASHGKGPLNRLYKARFGVTRMALHARSLVLDGVGAVAPLPEDLRAPLERLFGEEAVAALEGQGTR